ncbi:MAG: hypothetical protein Q4P20_00160 [Eubacteriales bacterium]|nr:hypothetical protein [Eubacteriales bacterium]
MFNLFRRNCLYNESIEPHCAYCAHCKPDNEYQGVCDYRGIVAMAGSCRRFEYDALRRRPPKPARIRGRFTADDFFFEENETDAPADPKPQDKPADLPHKPLISDDLSQFADLWEDDDAPATAPEPDNAASDEPAEQTEPDIPEETHEEPENEDE